jgi:threonyl-tRNA synthetase
VQAKVLPVSEKAASYAEQVVKELKQTGIRAELSGASESLGKRIRATEMEKIPYILIVGEKEAENKTISVRKRGGKAATDKAEDEAINIADLIAHLKSEIERKSIT